MLKKFKKVLASLITATMVFSLVPNIGIINAATADNPEFVVNFHDVTLHTLSGQLTNYIDTIKIDVQTKYGKKYASNYGEVTVQKYESSYSWENKLSTGAANGSSFNWPDIPSSEGVISTGVLSTNNTVKEFLWSNGQEATLDLKFANSGDGKMNVKRSADFYVYLWTRNVKGVYPYTKLAHLRTQGGKLYQVNDDTGVLTEIEISSLEGSDTEDSGDSTTINTYPYSNDMSVNDSTITLKINLPSSEAEATNSVTASSYTSGDKTYNLTNTTYQWEVSSETGYAQTNYKSATYSDVTGGTSTSLGLNVSNISDGKWYRCKVKSTYTYTPEDGEAETATREKWTKAIYFIDFNSHSILKGHQGRFYLTNGKGIYYADLASKVFDVIGKYENGRGSYEYYCSSYNVGWFFKGTTNPSGDSSYYRDTSGTYKDLQLQFRGYYIDFDLTLDKSMQAFSFGCDTMLITDSCPLQRTVEDGKTTQIKLINATTVEGNSDSEVMFVTTQSTTPGSGDDWQGTTAANGSYIGGYYHQAYNNTSTSGTYTDSYQGDSGLSLMWTNMTDTTKDKKISFTFGIGSQGAVLAGGHEHSVAANQLEINDKKDDSGNKLTHQVTYDGSTVNVNNTLTMTCENTEGTCSFGNNMDITLDFGSANKYSTVYDGNSHGVTLNNLTEFNGTDGLDDADKVTKLKEIVYQKYDSDAGTWGDEVSSAPTAVGKYRAYVVLKFGDTEFVLVKEFEITLQEQTGSIAFKTREDDSHDWSSDTTLNVQKGLKYEPVFTKADDSELTDAQVRALTYKYYSGNTELSEAPTESGSYTIKTTLPATTNYAETEISQVFTISHDAPTVLLQTSENLFQNNNNTVTDKIIVMAPRFASINNEGVYAIAYGVTTDMQYWDNNGTWKDVTSDDLIAGTTNQMKLNFYQEYKFRYKDSTIETTTINNPDYVEQLYYNFREVSAADIEAAYNSTNKNTFYIISDRELESNEAITSSLIRNNGNSVAFTLYDGTEATLNTYSGKYVYKFNTLNISQESFTNPPHDIKIAKSSSFGEINGAKVVTDDEVICYHEDALGVKYIIPFTISASNNTVNGDDDMSIDVKLTDTLTCTASFTIDGVAAPNLSVISDAKRDAEGSVSSSQGQIVGATAAMEYRAYNQLGYTDVTLDDDENFYLSPGVYYFRYKAVTSGDAQKTYSDDVRVTVYDPSNAGIPNATVTAPSTPTVGANATDATGTVQFSAEAVEKGIEYCTKDMSNVVDGGTKVGDENIITVSDTSINLAPGVYYFRYKATASNAASACVKVIVPERNIKISGLTTTFETDDYEFTGEAVITGLTTEMQYRVVKESYEGEANDGWIDVTSDVETKGLTITKGETGYDEYEIRSKQVVKSNAEASVQSKFEYAGENDVVIEYGPTLTLEVENTLENIGTLSAEHGEDGTMYNIFKNMLIKKTGSADTALNIVDNYSTNGADSRLEVQNLAVGSYYFHLGCGSYLLSYDSSKTDSNGNMVASGEYEVILREKAPTVSASKAISNSGNGSIYGLNNTMRIGQVDSQGNITWTDYVGSHDTWQAAVGTYVVAYKWQNIDYVGSGDQLAEYISAGEVLDSKLDTNEDGEYINTFNKYTDYTVVVVTTYTPEIYYELVEKFTIEDTYGTPTQAMATDENGTLYYDGLKAGIQYKKRTESGDGEWITVLDSDIHIDNDGDKYILCETAGEYYFREVISALEYETFEKGQEYLVSENPLSDLTIGSDSTYGYVELPVGVQRAYCSDTGLNVDPYIRDNDDNIIGYKYVYSFSSKEINVTSDDDTDNNDISVNLKDGYAIPSESTDMRNYEDALEVSVNIGNNVSKKLVLFDVDESNDDLSSNDNTLKMNLAGLVSTDEVVTTGAKLTDTVAAPTITVDERANYATTNTTAYLYKATADVNDGASDVSSNEAYKAVLVIPTTIYVDAIKNLGNKNCQVQYSTDNGTTWTTATASGEDTYARILVDQGSTIQLRYVAPGNYEQDNCQITTLTVPTYTRVKSETPSTSNFSLELLNDNNGRKSMSSYVKVNASADADLYEFSQDNGVTWYAFSDAKASQLGQDDPILIRRKATTGAYGYLASDSITLTPTCNGDNQQQDDETKYDCPTFDAVTNVTLSTPSNKDEQIIITLGDTYTTARPVMYRIYDQGATPGEFVNATASTYTINQNQVFEVYVANTDYNHASSKKYYNSIFEGLNEITISVDKTTVHEGNKYTATVDSIKKQVNTTNAQTGLVTSSTEDANAEDYASYVCWYVNDELVQTGGLTLTKTISSSNDVVCAKLVNNNVVLTSTSEHDNTLTVNFEAHDLWTAVSAVRERNVNPTCTTAGSYELAYYCTSDECNHAELHRTYHTVAALGHNAVTDAYVAATGASTGLTEGSHCSRCGATLVAQQTIAVIPNAVGYTYKTGSTECRIITNSDASRTVAYKNKQNKTKYQTIGETVNLNGQTFTVTALKRDCVNGTYVRTLTLASTITNWEYGAFNGDNRLTKINVKSTTLNVEVGAFAKMKASAKRKLKVYVTKKMSKAAFNALKAQLVREGLKASNIRRM